MHIGSSWFAPKDLSLVPKDCIIGTELVHSNKKEVGIMAWHKWDERKFFQVQAWFPQEDYEKLKQSAARNLRSVGKEAAILALAGLQEQEKRNEQKQQVG